MKDYGISLKRQGHIAIITLNRPAKQNAFDLPIWDCLDQMAAELVDSIGINGKRFKSFGADQEGA